MIDIRLWHDSMLIVWRLPVAEAKERRQSKERIC